MRASLDNMALIVLRQHALDLLNQMLSICEDMPTGGELDSLFATVHTLHNTLRTALDGPKMLESMELIKAGGVYFSPRSQALVPLVHNIASVVETYAHSCTPHEAWLFQCFDEFQQSMKHTALSLDKCYGSPSTDKIILHMIGSLGTLTKAAHARRQELLYWVLSLPHTEVVQPDLVPLLQQAAQYNEKLQTVKQAYPATPYIHTAVLSQLIHALPP